MKFVMFPSGVMFIPESSSHDDCRLCSSVEKQEEAVAAGDVILTNSGQGLDLIIFQGRSISLGLRAESVYPDWKERFIFSGLPVLCKYIEQSKKGIYFLPFSHIEKFNVWGVGKCSSQESCTLEDLLGAIK